MKINPASHAWTRALSFLALLVLWQLAATILQNEKLPGPLLVANRIGELLISGELAYQMGITLWRVAASFLIAMALGILIGIWMGKSSKIDRFFDGALVLGLNIPALVTIILCYVWFGLSEVAAILAVVVNKVPTVVVTIREGARAVDRHLLQVAKVFKLKPMTTFRRVYLPQLYPYFMAAARSGLALIWKIVLVVELLGRSNGVGFQLGTFFQFFDITGILAYTISFASIIIVIEGFLLRPFDRKIARWRV